MMLTKWTYVIKRKIHVAVTAMMFLLLLLVTHLIDKRQFSNLHRSFTSVYEDRLLAQAYIYEIADELNAKRIALIDNSHLGFKGDRSLSNSRIDLLISDLRKTTLTREEASLLVGLIQEFDALKVMEGPGVSMNEKRDSRSLDAIVVQYGKLGEKLSRLSKIQVEEAQKVMASSNSLRSLSYLNSQTEIAVLIFAGLGVQVLILAAKPTRPKILLGSRLN